MSRAKMLSAVATSATMLAVAGYDSGETQTVTGDDQQDGQPPEGFDADAAERFFLTTPEARQ